MDRILPHCQAERDRKTQIINDTLSIKKRKEKRNVYCAPGRKPRRSDNEIDEIQHATRKEYTLSTVEVKNVSVE